jgi:hypothetical protein
LGAESDDFLLSHMAPQDMAPRALSPFTVETKSHARNPRSAFPAVASDAQSGFPIDCEPDDLPVVDVRADMDDEAMRATERVFGEPAEDSPALERQAEQAPEPPSPAEALTPEAPSSPIQESPRPRCILPSVIQPETELQGRLREDQERCTRRGRRSLSEEEKGRRADVRKANAAKKQPAVVEDELPPLLAVMEAARPDDHQIVGYQELVPEPIIEPELVTISEAVEILQVQPSGTLAPCTRRRSRWVADRKKNVLLPGQRWKRRLPKVLR